MPSPTVFDETRHVWFLRRIVASKQFRYTDIKNKNDTIFTAYAIFYSCVQLAKMTKF